MCFVSNLPPTLSPPHTDYQIFNWKTIDLLIISTVTKVYNNKYMYNKVLLSI